MLKFGVVALLSLMFVVVPALAGVFKCADDSGAVGFQYRPCTGVDVIINVDGEADADQTAKHFLWQASAGKGTLFLLGSIFIVPCFLE